MRIILVILMLLGTSSFAEQLMTDEQMEAHLKIMQKNEGKYKWHGKPIEEMQTKGLMQRKEVNEKDQLYYKSAVAKEQRGEFVEQNGHLSNQTRLNNHNKRLKQIHQQIAKNVAEKQKEAEEQKAAKQEDKPDMTKEDRKFSRGDAILDKLSKRAKRKARKGN